MIVAYGSSETGKTTALRIAMSLIGIHDSICINRVIAIIGLGQHSVYEQFSNAFIAERASCGTLPFCIDDPPSKSKGSDVNDLIVYFYNKGQCGKSMRGGKFPLSMPLISNYFTVSTEEWLKYSMFHDCTFHF